MKSHVPQGLAPAVGSDDVQLLERLAAAHEGRGFDLAVIFTTATQSTLPAALLCRMAGIPARAAHVRENPYDLLTHWQRETDVVGPGMRHEVHRQLDPVASLGIPLPDDRGLVFALRSEARDPGPPRQRGSACGGR